MDLRIENDNGKLITSKSAMMAKDVQVDYLAAYSRGYSLSLWYFVGWTEGT